VVRSGDVIVETTTITYYLHFSVVAAYTVDYPSPGDEVPYTDPIPVGTRVRIKGILKVIETGEPFPNHTVTVEVKDPDGIIGTFDTVTTDSEGRFETAIRSLDKIGTYVFNAIAEDVERNGILYKGCEEEIGLYPSEVGVFEW